MTVEHDPRLVAQCRAWEALKPHAAVCRCDRCSILRGERTHWPRVYVEGAVEGGVAPDAPEPWRRTITGRVVRWAMAFELAPGVQTVNVVCVEYDETWRLTGKPLLRCNQAGTYAMPPRAAESRALAATA